MELNTEKLTGENLHRMLKLVEERDTIDKDLADLGTQRTELDTKTAGLTERRSAILKQIEEAAGAPVPAPALTASHNGNGHTPKGNSRTKKLKAAGKVKGKALGKGRGTGKRVAHGSVGDKILEALRESGPKGASIKHICEKFDLREDTVAKWLHTTLKNTKSGVKRPSRGQYVLTEPSTK
jgi:hypothetical protein